MDKNAEGFHHWLKNHPRFSGEGKNILYKNFGYPEEGLENTSVGDEPRARISKGEQDRKMLQMIHSYAQETGQQIDGYYNGIMANGALGSLKTENGNSSAFHAELAVFDGSVFSQPEMESKLNKEEIDLLNQNARRIRLEAEDREARRKSKRPRLNEEEEKVTPSKTWPAWGTMDKT